MEIVKEQYFKEQYFIVKLIGEGQTELNLNFSNTVQCTPHVLIT